MQRKIDFKLKPEELVELLKDEMEQKHIELAGRYDKPIPKNKWSDWKRFLESILRRYPEGYDSHKRIIQSNIAEHGGRSTKR